MRITCAQCLVEFERKAGHVNRSTKIGAPLYCGMACAGLARRVPPKSEEQKRAEKAAYDREYRERNAEKLRRKKAEWYQRTRDPEKERAIRQVRMPRHVEYCRRPEYKVKKHEYDIKRASEEYAEFAETWRLLLEVEKEIRSQASAYERRVANGYYTRNAQKRRRELWLLKQRN